MRPNLGEMELQRVIRAQTDIEPRFEELWERVSFVCQEKRVIAQRAHRESYLS